MAALSLSWGRQDLCCKWKIFTVTCRIFLVEHTCSWTSWWSSGPVFPWQTAQVQSRLGWHMPLWPRREKGKKGIFVLLDSWWESEPTFFHQTFHLSIYYIHTDSWILILFKGLWSAALIYNVDAQNVQIWPVGALWEPFKLALCPSTCSHHFLSTSLLSDPPNVTRSSCIFPVPQLLESVIFSREKRVYFWRQVADPLSPEWAPRTLISTWLGRVNCGGNALTVAMETAGLRSSRRWRHCGS